MDIRNIAIIAHVDHGKTTLVDQLLKQSGAFRDHQQVAERALDRNDLERERGITILAKCASVMWKDTRINIVDTPGHADFGGEVERILNMVDGAIVLVDAAEGVLPQTKFVVGKALERGLKPIVVVNKIDRQDARADEVHVEVFDLFAALGATDDQLDFPMLYASGRQGWATETLDGERKDLTPMFDLVLRHVKAPALDKDAPFAMVASILDYDNFLGRVLTGRLEQGRAKLNMPLKVLRQDGSVVETGRLTKLMGFRGLERVTIEEAEAGDIIAIAGLTEATIPDSIGAPELTAPIYAIPVDPPTLAMTFRINDGPLGGREGKKVTSRQIRDRLMRESEGNVAIKITESNESEAFEVAGRGELQLGVLIETMRREGFELTIGRPRVLTRDNPETGEREEPMEDVLVDVDEPYTGVVVEKMSPPQGRDAGHAPVRRRQGAADLPHAQPRPDRLSRRVPDRHPRHRHNEPPVRRLRPVARPDGRPPQRQPDFEFRRRCDSLLALVPAGARHPVRRSRRQGLSRHDPRRAFARQRSRREPDQREKAHQHPRRRQGRRDAADPAAPDEPGTGDRLYRGRRAGGDHPLGDPAAQALPRSERPQAQRAQGGCGGGGLTKGRRG